MEAQSARALELKSMPAKQQKNWEVRALKQVKKTFKGL